MATQLPPVPHKSPVTDKGGMISRVWSDLFERAFNWKNAVVTSGYQRLPSGLYIQWGVTGATVSGATAAVTFPTPFPTACLHVFPAIKDNSAVATTATGQVGWGAATVTACSIYNRTSVTQTMNWFAVGH